MAGVAAMDVKQESAKDKKSGELGITTGLPKFPQYALVTKRQESFENWPAYMPIKSDLMIDAGSVYTGVGDSVRCYFCGGGLRNWEAGDNPWEEHAKWYPKCPHVIQVKGLKYIDDVGKGIKPEPESRNQSQLIEALVYLKKMLLNVADAKETLQPEAMIKINSVICQELERLYRHLPHASRIYLNFLRQLKACSDDQRSKELQLKILDVIGNALCRHGNSINQTAEPGVFENNGSIQMSLSKLDYARPCLNDYIALLKCSACDDVFLQSVQYHDFLKAIVFLLIIHALFGKSIECANYSLQFPPNFAHFWGAADRSGLSHQVLSQENHNLVKRHQGNIFKNIPTLPEKGVTCTGDALLVLYGETASSNRQDVPANNGNDGHDDDKKYSNAPKILNACVICKRCRANILFIPCCHHIVCETCWTSGAIQPCPSCRRHIESFRKTIPA